MEGCMRIFIAIELSGEARGELRSLQSSLKEAGADVKWVDPVNIHLTLRFLGDCGESMIPSVKTALAEAVSAHEPFILGLKGVGAFPAISSPKVIWAGVGEGRQESEALHTSISSRLAGLGIPEEERDYSPHITIGRVRSGKKMESLRKAIEGSPFPASSGTTVDRVVLFSSRFSPEGPIYTPLSKAMLRRP
jgi:2'-5' RNA ligase